MIASLRRLALAAALGLAAVAPACAHPHVWITAKAELAYEAGLLTRGVSQVYASVGETGTDGRVGIRLYYKPLVLLIWIGSLVMALGGGLSLTDLRFRLAAPKRAAPAAAVQPAE